MGRVNQFCLPFSEDMIALVTCDTYYWLQRWCNKASQLLDKCYAQRALVVIKKKLFCEYHGTENRDSGVSLPFHPNFEIPS